MSSSYSSLTGLTIAEVEERVRRGLVNTEPSSTSRSAGSIIRANTLTLFNAILGTLLVLILIFGSLRDALFGLVIVSNSLIGIVQELRAKRTLDKLSVLSAPRATVIRDGQELSITVNMVVQDDFVELRRGDQVVADGQVLSAAGLELDESLLTGEAEPVSKKEGDRLLSGSFCAAGSGIYRADGIGPDSYARKLAAQAKRFQLVRSELQHGINRILRGIIWVMVPAGVLLFWRQLSGDSGTGEAVSGSVAAMVGMIPQGLVLLTSIAFAVAVVVLGRKKVLVQELPAVESLARVDVCCFDKTGTLTETGLKFGRVEMVTETARLRGDSKKPGEGGGEEEAGGVQPGGAIQGVPDVVARVLAVLAAGPDSRTPTTEALAEAFPARTFNVGRPEASVAFSSERKWSSVSIDGESWIIGAPEILMSAAGADDQLERRVKERASEGDRVLLLARHDGILTEEKLPPGLEPIALILAEEKIRPDAASTLAYFREQNVTIKVISGDNPATVAAAAARAGLEGIGKPVDARTLPEDHRRLAKALDQHTVFGRVTPQQKQGLVQALKKEGHIVAMTGDGVNDVLAVKEADIGIAVGKDAAAATKGVAQLILLDARFATLPEVVAEGRRVAADIERVAYLFVTKTAYATLLALSVGLLGWPFPFLPRHLTVVDVLTIGVPAFFLALAPSKARYRSGFIGRVLKFAIPAGILLGGATLVAYALTRHAVTDLAQERTVSTLVLTVMGLWVLVLLARPLTILRTLLILAMIGGLVIITFTPFINNLLAFEFPSGKVVLESLAAAAVALFILTAGMRLTGWEPRGAKRWIVSREKD